MAKLTLVCFPKGAAGKTLVNCLGFSPDAVLQSHRLAALDIQGKLTPEDKYNIVMNRLETIDEHAKPDQWTDLFFGEVPQVAYCGPASLKNFTIIENSNRRYFITAHNNFSITALMHEIGPVVVDAVFVRETVPLLAARTSREKFKVDDPEDFVQAFPPGTLNTHTIFPASSLLTNKYASHIRSIYRLLGLTGFNERYITTYIEAWKKINLEIG